MHTRPIHLYPTPTPLHPLKKTKQKLIKKKTKQKNNERLNTTSKQLFLKFEKRKKYVGLLLLFFSLEESKRHKKIK